MSRVAFVVLLGLSAACTDPAKGYCKELEKLLAQPGNEKKQCIDSYNSWSPARRTCLDSCAKKARGWSEFEACEAACPGRTSDTGGQLLDVCSLR